MSWWKELTFATLVAVSVAYLMYSLGGGMGNDSLINFLIVVRMIVPTILAFLGAAWFATKVGDWWYDRNF